MIGPRIQALAASMAACCLVLLQMATPVAAEPLTAPMLYAFLDAYRIQAPVPFSPPYPLVGARLDLTDTRVNGTWISSGGDQGPILLVENFGNGTMGVALLLPAAVIGTPIWLSSMGSFGVTSIFGGTFYLGPLSGAGLSGDDTLSLSWLSDAELLFTFFPAEWIGPPVSVAMWRLKDAL